MPQISDRSNDRRHVARRIALVLGAGLFASAAGFVGGGPLRLNQELAHGVVGYFPSTALTPDGSRVVYLASFSSVVELYVSPSDGSGGAIRLSAPLVAGGNVQSFVIAPDGSSVLYRADQETDGVVELYAVPIDGSLPPVNLNGTIANVMDGGRFSPDGAWVVFTASSKNEVYSAAVDGSQAAVKLNGTLVAGANGFVQSVSVSPDGARVLYRASQNAALKFELFSVPIGGGTAVQLSGAMVAQGDVEWEAISADGAWVVYRADQATNDVVELFGVPIAGGAALRLNQALAPAEDVVSATLSSEAGVPSVVYRVNQAGGSNLYSVPADLGQPPVLLTTLAPNAGTNYSIAQPTQRVVYQSSGSPSSLFSVPLLGGASPVQLSSAPRSVTYYRIGPDGTRVAYWISPGGPGVPIEVHCVPIDGSAAAAVLSGGLPVSILGDLNPLFSPDGARVVFTAGGGIYSAPVDGSLAPASLTEPAIEAFVPATFAFDSASSAVVRALAEGPYEVYRLQVDGSSPPVPVNAPLAPLGEVTSFQLGADGSRVVYTASEPILGVSQLHCADPEAGPPSAVCVNDPLPPSSAQGSVEGFVVTNDASTAVFAAPQDDYGLTHLYVVPTDAGAPPLRLDDDLGDVASPLLAPDEQSVLYTFRSVHSPMLQVRLARLDGSLPPLVLQGSFGLVSDVRFSADGEHALLRSLDIYENGTLYSLALDGSRPAAQLDVANVSASYALSADGSRVFYLRGPLAFSGGGPSELRSTLVDGSGAPVVLNGPLVAGGGVSSFGLTPDGLSVCYRARQDFPDRIELYVASTDASAPIRRLSPPLVPGGNVRSMAVAPSSAYVVYTADQDAFDRVELYSVLHNLPENQPASGRTRAMTLHDRGSTRLNPTLVSGGDVLAFTFSPDGKRVVYLADQGMDEERQLYSVRTNGLGSAVRLNGPLVSGGDALAHRITPDGQRVLYTADQTTNDVVELFSVPITGGTPVRLSAPPASGGDVLSFVISADSQWVVYLADQNADEVRELFRARVDGSGSPEWISGPFVTGGDVAIDAFAVPYRLGPDAGTVVFGADKLLDGRNELFAFHADAP